MLAKTEWLDPLLYLGEALDLLLVLRVVRDLEMGIYGLNYFKIVVDSLYGSKNDVSNYSVIINDWRRLLALI